MEQQREEVNIDALYADVQSLIQRFQQADETTMSFRLSQAMTGRSNAEILPMLRHELFELRRNIAIRKLKLEARLDALLTQLDLAVQPYGFRPLRQNMGTVGVASR